MICHPKAEAGLGVENILSWNKACVLQLVWALVMNSDSPWIAWVKEYKLKRRVEKWKFEGKKYKISAVWNELRPKAAKVDWARLIRSIIPKHAMIRWIAILNRLPTKDPMKSWGLIVSEEKGIAVGCC
ncbi:hypothetical protein PTKIN_Ptkin14bG0028300 [Pterospermum kingtungense]